MNAIVRKRSLNDVFKRFQRLPELPMVKIGDNGFGELYIVSVTQGPLGDNPKISLKPDLTEGLSNQMADASARATGGRRSHQPSV
jgi:hypothetical protein